MTPSFQTKSDVAYTNLQKLIASQKWLPGQRMTVHKIAIDLGTSETPVREALKRLEAEGYVHSVHIPDISQKKTLTTDSPLSTRLCLLVDSSALKHHTSPLPMFAHMQP